MQGRVERVAPAVVPVLSGTTAYPTVPPIQRIIAPRDDSTRGSSSSMLGREARIRTGALPALGWSVLLSFFGFIYRCTLTSCIGNTEAEYC